MIATALGALPDRERRDSDGDVIEQVRDLLPHCPWCDDVLDPDGECSRRCRASRVNRTDER